VAPYYEIFIERPFSLQGEPQTEYTQVWDRPISFVEKLQIGPRRYLLFGQRPVEFEVYTHDIAVIRIRKDVSLILRNYGKAKQKSFKTNSGKIPFLNFPDRDTMRVRFLKGQEFAIYKTSFFLEGRNDQQIQWGEGMDGYDFFDDLCLLEISKCLEPEPKPHPRLLTNS
jgi:hypothetical protein